MEAVDSDGPGANAAPEELLRAFAVADESATRLVNEGLDQMLPQIYEELRAMAANHMRHERSEHTLQPTALVHETYLRLLGQRTPWQNRAHLLAIAARMMRRILVNHAAARNAQKRGAGMPRVALDDVIELCEREEIPALEVNHALTELEKLDARQAQIAELRFFGGLNVEETAEVLGVSTATVKREWRVAKLWLKRELAAA